MKLEVINLTAHVVVVEGGILEGSYDPSGQVARVETTSKEVGPGFFETQFGEVEGLPKPVAGTLLVVSDLVRSAVPDRWDVVSPGESVLGEDGKAKACKGLRVNEGFATAHQGWWRTCCCGNAAYYACGYGPYCG